LGVVGLSGLRGGEELGDIGVGVLVVVGSEPRDLPLGHLSDEFGLLPETIHARDEESWGPVRGVFNVARGQGAKGLVASCLSLKVVDTVLETLHLLFVVFGADLEGGSE